MLGSAESKANELDNRTLKINKWVKIGTVIFSILTFFHMYFFQNDWSFITSFFTGSPIPWIISIFLVSLFAIAIKTYLYFRKYL
ncbi:MAG: hypothetical protein OEV78_06635 [Spirochaetia bacterium]|nr:hypothetical protein [Spirochaetia bacterium]